jgi:Phospholipase_D-nuclease N-terminal
VDTRVVLALVLPILAIQLVLIVLALRDLLRPDRRVVGGNKLVWGIVIVGLELFGPVIYFLVGRETE